MVNTHGKFPGDAKHNAYYAADGSDVRDATKEEVKKVSPRGATQAKEA